MTNETLLQEYIQTRENFLSICSPLEIEDYCLQGAAFASPPKWHLGHTTWFFETFILKPLVKGYQVFHPAFEVLFNSYYNGIGEQHPRPERGLLTRPTLHEVIAYRHHVDNKMRILLSDPDHPDIDTITTRCILGLQHEKQHQELFFTDIKYSFSKNPLFPAYKPLPTQSSVNTDETAIEWVRFEGGLVPIGQEATKIDRTDNFYFDNESPAHQVFLAPFSLANRLVTNKEFQAFIDDGGYKRPEFWLSDGWDAVQKNGWQAPLHWVDNKNQPGKEFTLYGLQERQPNHPVCHVSGYEADAYANWAGERLPTETEWEWAAKQQPMAKKPKKPLHPESAENNSTLIQLYDQCWQWTGSAYRPYPGFEPPKGAIGEYNGKFMCNQWVLRGGSCVSPDNHLRTTYRNFFYPEDRWQFSGIRLAKK